MFFRSSFAKYLVLNIFYLFLSSKLALAAQTYSMGNSGNWNIRVDGASAGDGLGATILMETADFNSNGKNDLLIVAYGADYNSRGNSGSVYIISDQILSSTTSSGNTIDLSDSSTYNLRIDGPVTGCRLGFGGAVSGDIDNDGRVDILIDSIFSSNNSRASSGSVFLIKGSILQPLLTTRGNTLDLAVASNYNLRFDGSDAGSWLGGGSLVITDLDNNGSLDTLIGSRASNNSRSTSGSLYVMYNSLLTSYAGTGNNIDLATSTNYNLRFDGASAGDVFTEGEVAAADINGNGMKDIIAGGDWADNNNRQKSGSVWVVYDSIFTSYAGTGNNIDLATSTNYNLRFDGASVDDTIGSTGGLVVADLKNNGRQDILISSRQSDNNSRIDSGSVYVMYNSLLTSYAGTGNNIDLASSSSYNLRFDGPATGSDLSHSGISVSDYFSSGKNDIILDAAYTNGSGTDTGSVYIIGNNIFSSAAGKGHTYDLNSVNNYTIRYNGANINDYFGYIFRGLDMYGNNKVDLVVASMGTGYNSRAGAGSIYIIYNFPHTVSITESSRNSNVITLKGVVSAPSSVTNISGVEYRVDSDNPEPGWTSCDSIDGSFNSKAEEFRCVVSNIPESSGTHTIYVRSYDANHSHTAKSRYATHTYSIDQVDRSYQIPFSQDPTAPGKFVTAIPLDNITHESLPLTHIEPGTFNFNAFLSTEVIGPKESNTQGIKLPSVYTPIGDIHSLWYKAYHPTTWTTDAAKIIPSLQEKPSTITLRYKDEDLKTIAPTSLKLAHSLDGKSWKLLPNSVVDKTNHTVSAIERVGGYYVIVKSGATSTLTATTKTPTPTTTPLTQVEELVKRTEVSPSFETPKQSFLGSILNMIGELFR